MLDRVLGQATCEGVDGGDAAPVDLSILEHIGDDLPQSLVDVLDRQPSLGRDCSRGLVEDDPVLVEQFPDDGPHRPDVNGVRSGRSDRRGRLQDVVTADFGCQDPRRLPHRTRTRLDVIRRCSAAGQKTAVTRYLIQDVHLRRLVPAKNVSDGRTSCGSVDGTIEDPTTL